MSDETTPAKPEEISKVPDPASQLKQPSELDGIIRHEWKTLVSCTVANDYRFSMKEGIAKIAGYEEPEVKIKVVPEKFPVKWDSDKYEISCRPDTEGDFSIYILVKVPGKGEKHLFPFKLPVNSDRKTPSNQDADKRKEIAPKASINQNNDTQIDAAHKTTVNQGGNMQTDAAAKTSLDQNGGAMPMGGAEKPILHKITLPNCRTTGIDYCVPLEKEIDKFINLKGAAEFIVNPKIDCSAGFAVSWDPDKHEISCHPDQAGDFEINLFADVRRDGRQEKHQFQFKLTVNPDPKSLWKNIPSKQDGLYAKPDSDKHFRLCDNNLSIIAASQRGRSHAQVGSYRDDDFVADWDAGTACAILAVADGAGSAKFSRKGSKIATQAALEKVKEALGVEFWAGLEPSIKKYVEDKDVQARTKIQNSLYMLIQAAWEAKARIKKEAEDCEKEFLATYKKNEKFTARDFATTLILTIAKKLDKNGRWFIATYWVGDGGMGVYSSNPEMVIVQGTPDGGEYGGQTRFLTEDSREVWPQGDDAARKIIERRISFDIVDSFDAVVLMTDGISDPKFETDSNLNSIGKWNELWTDIKKEVPFEKRDESVADSLLKWMDFWSPGNHDDRTMLVLHNMGGINGHH